MSDIERKRVLETSKQTWLAEPQIQIRVRAKASDALRTVPS